MTSPTSRTSDSPPVTASVRIAAPPDVVFPYFTDPALAVKWIADAAYLDARPGGTFSLNVRGNPALGEFVEVDPPRRVVFTWGIEGQRRLPAGEQHGRGGSAAPTATTPSSPSRTVTCPPRSYRRSHQGGWAEFLGILGDVGLLGC